ncbi:Ser/Thr protein kinase RdoA (MazF antagonist) [Paenibacillus rhizosphaerae]|uniref:Ser/Thr protein kinase RdoA (MazF antagonist) n=1 Tax=Paenibacillus rhizosphaerae TaxID=297318 RepID=A0A839TV02_9BACL|nr:phosphotransferase [Paenibacillus rhizosphaerae]MBB3130676.1 Ser/Thr protein kinase RdoA (MazF antagonist) [Paenibacillus rhizosphaerae]
MAHLLGQREIRSISRRFRLQALRCTPVSSLYRKNAVIQIQTNLGTFALKPYNRNPHLRSGLAAQIKSAAKNVRLLMNNAYGFIPDWLPADSGKLWVMHRGKPFYMTAWIHGRPMGMEQDYEQLGLALAKLHTLRCGLPHTPQSATLEQVRLWKAKDHDLRKNMVRASSVNPALRRAVRQYGTAWKRFSDEAWSEIRHPDISRLCAQEKASPALIHGDITPPNVIIANDERLHIIDWDFIRVGSTYADTAKTIMNTTGFHTAFMEAFLRGYEGIRPLSLPERRLVKALYGLPREAWYAVRFPKSKRSTEMLKTMDQTWTLRRQSMEYMNSWANP